MTLPEAFEKYDDTVRLRRKSFKQKIIKSIYDKGQINKAIENGMGSLTIEFLKNMMPYENDFKLAREIGLMIGRLSIDDANADDWEVHEPTK